ncbi:thiol-activated cytolysin C-terminal domain-containing protein [Mameliella alba]|uniref:thiol-activated cytolysin C-terminal domain-containing protein n=1 Tax=Mameliella alba TaxID=561184 RepID=UPI000B5360C3|nr:thiol-activated cytolysin C-terminal domain-containing protein [Mameliella alba]OWV44323.1 hypothetical protein CDZ95_06460 [Mameliella alba]
MSDFCKVAVAAPMVFAFSLFVPDVAQAADSRVCVKNDGAFVARFEVDYDEGGRRVHTHSGNFTAGTQKCIRVPEDSTNMFVSAQEEWFIASWSTVCEKGFDGPEDLNLTLSGATLNAKCSGM